MKRFALIGAAGYIAPRHMRAIKETGNRLVAAFDPSDNVGVLDRFFSDVSFFTEFERFDRYIDKVQRSTEKIDYLVVCSPNYLHDAHCRYGLKAGMDVICEKPLVINPWNIDGLIEAEKLSGKQIFTILQLRLHPQLIALKKSIEKGTFKSKYQVELNYITTRGPWYQVSWKGDLAKSGGIISNIGIHFFDILNWLFGSVVSSELDINTSTKASGRLILQNAEVNWLLSIDSADLPKNIQDVGGNTYRSLHINKEHVSLDSNFEELHTQSYTAILNGNGFGIDDAKSSIITTHHIRTKSNIPNS